MEYTIQKLGKLAGVSSRTLRYYDEIGILKPARINSSGYRVYGQFEVDRLQQILFYRELGVSLEEIHTIVTSPNFNSAAALMAHRERLLEKRSQLDQLIENVNKTIANTEGRILMSDKEKFEGFKKKMVEENEMKYGKEIREKYGEDMVNSSNEKIMNMSEGDHEKHTALSNELTSLLAEAYKLGDPSSEIAQKVADLHRQWLNYYWPEGQYNKEAHYGIAQMYTEDPRFTAYYDKEQPGTAAFLKEAIRIYTGH